MWSGVQIPAGSHLVSNSKRRSVVTLNSQNEQNGEAHENGLIINRSDDFLLWITTKFGEGYVRSLRSYFNRFLKDKKFNSPFELSQYLSLDSSGKRNKLKTARVYLNFCEELELVNEKKLVKYRKVLKLEKSKNDYFVPSNEDVLTCYKSVKEDDVLELIFLILVTSGIRFVECIDFIRSYDDKKFKICNGFVMYSVANNRRTKNINNIFLPLFVYEKLKHIKGNTSRLQSIYNKKATFNAKYCRKWNYNFLLYNGVPEGVADFIQGRASKSIGTNHYLAKNQQSEFWYAEIVKKLEVLLKFDDE